MRRTLIAIGLLLLVAAALGLALSSREPPRTVEDLGPVYCLAVSRDGQHIVSGHQDSRARVWRVDSGELLHTFGRERPAVVCAAFSPDGRHVAYAHADEFVRIRELATGLETTLFRGHQGTVITVAYMPDGRRILSGGSDNTIRLRDLESGMQERCFVGHNADVNAVAAFADGRRIISASGDYWGGRVNDSSIRVWDVATGKELMKFVGEFAPLKNLVLSPDNRTAVTCSWDTGIQVWDVDEGKEIRRFGDKYTESIALSPDGKRVVSGAYGLSNTAIKLWSVDTGELLLEGPAHASTIGGISFLPDGIHVVACSGHWGSRGGKQKTDWLGEPIGEAVDCTLRLWDMKRGVEVRRSNRLVKQ